MTPTRGGFPYFQIAKQYGVDYTDVLLVADHYTHQRGRLRAVDAMTRLQPAVIEDIGRMVDEFRTIQREGWN